MTRKFVKTKQTHVNAWLVKVERYHGPFIRSGKNAMTAVLDVMQQHGMFYLNNKFEVTEIKCRTSCIAN